MLATAIFALPGSIDRHYALDYRAGPVDATITSIETMPNGRPLLFGWERFTVGRETFPKPTIRRDYEFMGPPLPSIGCTRGLVSVWGAYYASAVQPDGKYLITGYTFERYTPNFRRLLVVRCNQDLSLDTSFGNGGLLITQFGPGTASYGHEIFTTPGGKIAVAGSYSENGGNYRPAVAQFNGDGSPDSSFGQKGITLIDRSLGRQQVSAALQPDGKIVLAGTDPGPAFTLLRLLPDGTEDLSFGSSQPVRTMIGSQGSALAEIKLQSDGKVVAAGTAYGNSDSDLALACYNADGSLDSSFGSAGIVVSDKAPGEKVSALELQPNGKLLVGGQNHPAGSSEVGIVARFFPSGIIDREFGVEGTATPVSPMVQDIKVVGDTKFVIAGPGTVTPFAMRLWGNERNSIPRFDFDGDGKSDLGYFDPANSNWNFFYSGGGVSRIKWGLSTDTLAPADYDGDGKMNLAVFRDGDWHILSLDGTFSTTSFGQAGDLPRPGDFDSDGKADFAVFRPSNGLWIWRESSTNFLRQRYFGMAGDIPLISDFGGFGYTAPVIFRPSTGTWYQIGDNWPSVVYQFRFGMEGDVPFTGDFDGDKITDYTVYRPSTGMWYRYSAYTSQIIAQHFGTTGDIPVAGDYNGDGKSEIAVYRPSTGTWYILDPENGFTAVDFGAKDVKPLLSVY